MRLSPETESSASVYLGMGRTFPLWITLGLLFASSCSQKPTSSNPEASTAAARPVDYSPRIGIGVRTGSRTCVAIQNTTLSSNAPVTVVNAGTPQTFVEAQISGPSKENCPITQTVPVGISSYDVSLPPSADIPKLMPFVAVLGTAASNEINVAGNGVVADLEHSHTKNTFRACGADDGVHVSIWRNDPVTGTLVWSAYYFEAGNPGTLPTCTAAELAPVPIGH